ncbi:MAG: 7-cyano-7-deazaguanine synthase [Adlercreutzia equolifaciens]
MEAPFVTWSKADIVREGLALGVPYELTWSCYEGGEAPCGRCATCLDHVPPPSPPTASKIRL